ncbi:hypothetical protein DXV75_16810 [Alteromonas aestuariivivens]|uniref:Uncharacterized protein n=1 Tax=Alteromonas aestuariivivens TaxID=1938339 RepID=A0A3D8M2P0_9ALTE|nr:hypothetical protein [Alteromonas aestuariivivens]RDV23901.1 hypothetical protein DXV75_16810 [Alteromonas aestuariivivens]
MAPDTIKEYVKSFGSHFLTILILIGVLYFLFKEEINNFIDKYNSVSELQVELAQEKMKNKLNSDETAFFQNSLNEYLESYASIDLSNKNKCDDEYLRKFNEAEARLDALEALSKSLGNHNEFSEFFQNQRGSMRSIIGCP